MIYLKFKPFVSINVKLRVGGMRGLQHPQIFAQLDLLQIETNSGKVVNSK